MVQADLRRNGGFSRLGTLNAVFLKPRSVGRPFAAKTKVFFKITEDKEKKKKAQGNTAAQHASQTVTGEQVLQQLAQDDGRDAGTDQGAEPTKYKLSVYAKVL